MHVLAQHRQRLQQQDARLRVLAALDEQVRELHADDGRLGGVADGVAALQCLALQAFGTGQVALQACELRLVAQEFGEYRMGGRRW